LDPSLRRSERLCSSAWDPAERFSDGRARYHRCVEHGPQMGSTLVFCVRRACDLLVRNLHPKGLALMHLASSHLELIAPSDAGRFNVMFRPNPDAGALTPSETTLGLFASFFAGLAVGVLFFGSSHHRRSFAR
jgi:hypothetical protein